MKLSVVLVVYGFETPFTRKLRELLADVGRQLVIVKIRTDACHVQVKAAHDVAKPLFAWQEDTVKAST